MSKDSLWFGYLEIGEKSTPVALEPRLNTSNPETLYLFHFQRNEFVEYKRDIVKTKLRDFTEDEADLNQEVKQAYIKAVKEFTPRGKTLAIPDKQTSKPAPAKKKKAEKLEKANKDDNAAVDD
jgi:hypothetical protein